MLGAIIGDLAASTYLRDKKEFYARMIGDNATIPELSVAVLWAAQAAKDWDRCNDNIRLKQFIDYIWRAKQNKNLDLSEDAWRWAGSQNMYANPSGIGMFLMRQGTLSYWFDWESGKRDRIDFGMDKEEMYASMFLSKMLTLLRLGWTKDEVWKELGSVFQGCFKDWKWRTETGRALNYLFRGWECFYKAYDFGSAIHKAVKMIGDVRTNCAVTGMVAAAMYGCEQYFIKEKYDSEHRSPIQLRIPHWLDRTPELKDIREQLRWVNVFWPKNDSRTNTEWHIYKPIESKFENHRISREIHRRILKSFAPDWDHRFSFYKENGWIYLCRSFHILGRFRFRYDDGDFIIKDIQGDGFEKDIDDSLHDILFSIDREWALLTNLFKYYSCHYPEETCPTPYKGTVKEKFWEGEKMFNETQMNNLGQWIRDGKKAVESSDNPKLLSMAKAIGPERFGVVYFINTLYAKWCPWDNLDWIFEY